MGDNANKTTKVEKQGTLWAEVKGLNSMWKVVNRNQGFWKGEDICCGILIIPELVEHTERGSRICSAMQGRGGRAWTQSLAFDIQHREQTQENRLCESTLIRTEKYMSKFLGKITNFFCLGFDWIPVPRYLAEAVGTKKQKVSNMVTAGKSVGS